MFGLIFLCLGFRFKPILICLAIMVASLLHRFRRLVRLFAASDPPVSGPAASCSVTGPFSGPECDRPAAADQTVLCFQPMELAEGCRSCGEVLGSWGLISPEVFPGHIVLRDLPRVNFRHVCVRRIFHTAQCVGLEGLPLFQKLYDAL